MTNLKAFQKIAGNMSKVAAIAGLSVAAIAVAAPMASASGASGVTNGCFSTWGSTGTDAHCTVPHVTVTGNYANHAACDFEPDHTSAWSHFPVPAEIFDFGQIDCTFSVSWSSVAFTG